MYCMCVCASNIAPAPSDDDLYVQQHVEAFFDEDVVTGCVFLQKLSKANPPQPMSHPPIYAGPSTRVSNFFGGYSSVGQ